MNYIIPSKCKYQSYCLVYTEPIIKISMSINLSQFTPNFAMDMMHNNKKDRNRVVMDQYNRIMNNERSSIYSKPKLKNTISGLNDLSNIISVWNTSQTQWQIWLDTKVVEPDLKTQWFKCKTIVHNMWYQRELGSEPTLKWYWDRWTKLNYSPNIEIDSIAWEICYQLTGPIIKLNTFDMYWHLNWVNAFETVDIFDLNRRVIGWIPEEAYRKKWCYWSKTVGAWIAWKHDKWSYYLHPYWALMKNLSYLKKSEGTKDSKKEIQYLCSIHIILKNKDNYAEPRTTNYDIDKEIKIKNVSKKREAKNIYKNRKSCHILEDIQNIKDQKVNYKNNLYRNLVSEYNDLQNKEYKEFILPEWNKEKEKYFRKITNLD